MNPAGGNSSHHGLRAAGFEEDRLERGDDQGSRPSGAPTTVYTGPVVVTRLEFGGRAVSVVRPADPDRMLDDPAVREWNRRDDYMPYWAYLWPGALLLAEAVVREPWPVAEDALQPLEAIEIGCGVGLAGLAALGQGLRVSFTDYDQAPLHFVTRSAEVNGFNATHYSTGLMDWAQPARRDVSGGAGLGRPLRAPAGAHRGKPAGEDAQARRAGPDRMPGAGICRGLPRRPDSAGTGLPDRVDRITSRGQPADPRSTLPGREAAIDRESVISPRATS